MIKQLKALLLAPIPHRPLKGAVADQYIDHRAAYDSKVREMVAAHASPFAAGSSSDLAAVLKEVRRNGCSLLFASDELKSNLEVVRAAVSQNWQALRYASAELQADPELQAITKQSALEGVAQDWRKLKSADARLQADLELQALAKPSVLQAVTQDGLALEHAPVALQADAEVVRAAVAQNGRALKYASTPLRLDHELQLIAATEGGCLEHVSAALQSDKGVVLAAVAKNGAALQHASSALQADRHVVRVAVTQSGTYRKPNRYSQQGWEENSVLSFASKELWADPALRRLGALKGPSFWNENERRLPHALLRLGLFAELEHAPAMLDEQVTLEELKLFSARQRLAFARWVHLPADGDAIAGVCVALLSSAVFPTLSRARAEAATAYRAEHPEGSITTEKDWDSAKAAGVSWWPWRQHGRRAMVRRWARS